MENRVKNKNIKDYKLKLSLLPKVSYKEKIMFNIAFQKFSDDVRNKVWQIDLDTREQFKRFYSRNNSLIQNNLNSLPSIKTTHFHTQNYNNHHTIIPALLNHQNLKKDEQYNNTLTLTSRNNLKYTKINNYLKKEKKYANRTAPIVHKHAPKLCHQNLLLSLETTTDNNNNKTIKDNYKLSLINNINENDVNIKENTNQHSNLSNSFSELKKTSLNNSFDKQLKQLNYDNENLESWFIKRKSKQEKKEKKWKRKYKKIKWRYYTSENEKELRPDKSYIKSRGIQEIRLVIKELRNKKKNNTKDMIAEHQKNEEVKKMLEKRHQKEKKQSDYVNSMIVKIKTIARKIDENLIFKKLK